MTAPAKKAAAKAADAPADQQVTPDLAVLLAEHGLTLDDVETAKKVLADANGDIDAAVAASTGDPFDAQIKQVQGEIAKVKDDDPDRAAALASTIKGLHAERRHAQERGGKYRTDVDLCNVDWPEGWPLGSHHVSCEHGEYDR